MASPTAQQLTDRVAALTARLDATPEADVLARVRLQRILDGALAAWARATPTPAEAASQDGGAA